MIIFSAEPYQIAQARAPHIRVSTKIAKITVFRHCEERGDEAIQHRRRRLDCFAELVVGPRDFARARGSQ
jgi:hypothetical protein